MKPSVRFRNLHFVGIGGAGMSALAETLAGFGFSIRGSDRSESPALSRLRSLDISAFVGHDAAHVETNCDAVVFSAAVESGNPELQVARKLGIPVVRRAELLGCLMARKHGLAVAGTHGKTTTTGMLIHILQAAKCDPAWVSGGVWSGGEAGHAGNGEFLVAEADEYDRAFLSLRPVSAIVTNIDADHLDIYGTLAAIEDAFAQFLNALPFHGLAVVNGEDAGIGRILERLGCRVRTYGISAGDYHATRVEMKAKGATFTLWRHGVELGPVSLRVPGLHNVSNALAAAALALEEGVAFDAVATGLAAFPGMSRRMEYIGSQNGVTVMDDYAHHPTEVVAALKAARLLTNGRLAVLFQPHLYSRTQQLLREFSHAFLASDLLFVLPVYAARENPIPGIEGNSIVEEAVRLGHPSAHFLSSRDRVAAEVAGVMRSGDLCLTMGAGNVGELAPEILEALA